MSEYRASRAKASSAWAERPFPLKPEGTDDNADDISPLFLGQTGRFRSYAGSRSPSQPGGKDGQRAAFQRTENGRLAFTGRLGSYGGVSAGTEALVSLAPR